MQRMIKNSKDLPGRHPEAASHIDPLRNDKSRRIAQTSLLECAVDISPCEKLIHAIAS
jgi:hypothetical protein